MDRQFNQAALIQYLVFLFAEMADIKLEIRVLRSEICKTLLKRLQQGCVKFHLCRNNNTKKPSEMTGFSLWSSLVSFQQACLWDFLLSGESCLARLLAKRLGPRDSRWLYFLKMSFKLTDNPLQVLREWWKSARRRTGAGGGWEGSMVRRPLPTDREVTSENLWAKNTSAAKYRLSWESGRKVNTKKWEKRQRERLWDNNHTSYLLGEPGLRKT